MTRALGALAAGGLALLWTVELAPAADRGAVWVTAAAVAFAVAVLPRAGWIGAVAAALVASASAGRTGEAVLLAAMLLPCVPLMWRAPEWWSLPSLAPMLGAPGLSGAWPAGASFAGSVWLRFAAGAVGAWQVGCAELLLGKTLLGGPPAAADTSAAWANSASAAVSHALEPLLAGPLPAVAGIWGLGAAVLPMAIAGRSAVADALAGAIWAAAIGFGTAAVSGGWTRGILAGALAGAAVAVASRGFRPPAPTEADDGPRTMIERLRRAR